MTTKGWIAVDFDGTIAEYHGWAGWNHFGAPIPKMVERIKAWLKEGKDVRVFTARIQEPLHTTHHCRITGQSYTGHDMIYELQRYTLEHVGHALEVTCVKDLHMIELWDDRAREVVPNTGKHLQETIDELRAENDELRGQLQDLRFTAPLEDDRD